MLFSERSIWTMIHGIGMGGGALLALSAALFAMYLLRAEQNLASGPGDPPRSLAALTTLIAAALWLTAIVGTYVVFPPYRTPPPEGAADLGAFPRALLLADPETAWLHAYAMETKEHLPWIAVMLSTAVAFVAWRYRSRLLSDTRLRSMATALLGICFVIVAYVSLLGIFINKVAPLE